jgi:hypothetical protein
MGYAVMIPGQAGTNFTGIVFKIRNPFHFSSN